MQQFPSRRRLLHWIASSAAVGWTSPSRAASTRAKRVDEAVMVRRVSIELPHLPPGLDGFRIVQISDLHLEPFTKPHHIEETVKMCQSLNPDLIAMTGDFVTNDTKSMGLLGELLTPLQAPCGIFACLGNHDFWSGHDEVIKVLEERGVPVLRNEMRLIHTDGGVLPLAGMDTRYMGRANIRTTLTSLRPDQPLVIMMHEPDVADDLATAGVSALQLSGHTHGGQVRWMGKPPSRLRRARWGREYIAGQYQVGPVQLYVNQGIGCVGLPVRIHCPPEVTEITLRSRECKNGLA